MALNPRQEKFCQLWSESGNATESYQAVSECSEAVAATMGWKWLRKVEIQDRIAEIQGENRELCTLSREELLDYAASALMTPVGAIDEHSPLCEEVTDTDQGKRIKMFSKTHAFDKIARMCGYYEPEKHEHSADDGLSELLRMVTGARE